MNIILPLFMIFLMNSCVCMDLAQNKEETTEISELCAVQVNRINEDSNKLYAYLAGSFEAIALIKPSDFKPSDFLAYLNSKDAALDDELPLEYASATVYIRHCLLPVSDQLDKDFDNYCQQIEDLEKVWLLSGKRTQKALDDSLICLKRGLVEYDQQKRALDQQGMHEVSDTLFVNLSMADVLYEKATNSSPQE